jgi:benzoyl-CoA reductase/2-hydroxyglutaryl-CoA dehydratase subunit BcrC/BadD/HgdB
MPQGGVPAAPNRSHQGPDDLLEMMKQYAQQYQLDQAEIRNIMGIENRGLQVYYDVTEEPQTVTVVAVGIKTGNRVFIGGEEKPL